MLQASITDLEARLAHYLREVRQGREVEILDLGVPVARLTAIAPVAGRPGRASRQELIEAGILSPGTGNAGEILANPLLELPVSLLESLEEERADRLE